MGLFSFFKFLKAGPVTQTEPHADEYAPSYWEDDYCQIEIVPSENREFIKKQSKQIEELVFSTGNKNGFTEIFTRGNVPVTTLSKEFRTDYFEKTMVDAEFQKARFICLGKSEILNCETGKTKAFGFSNFTIFFDTEDEFVNNIWLNISLIVSAPQFELIQDTLYNLGEACDFLLVDWNTLEIVDLKDRNQINNYLLEYWK